jgi:hypothetical protein
MREETEIKSVEMVRRIRDELADILKGKSHAEIIEFYRKAGDAARQQRRHREGIRAQQADSTNRR